MWFSPTRSLHAHSQHFKLIRYERKMPSSTFNLLAGCLAALVAFTHLAKAIPIGESRREGLSQCISVR